MTDFNYNLNIPNPPNRPSSDVNLMQTNTNSIAGWASIDHVGYGTTNNLGGTHLQTAFGGFSTGPLPPGPEGSVMYPAAGTASNTTSQLYFDNSLASVVISAVRAFGSIPAPTFTGPYPQTIDITPSNSYNVLVGVGQSNVSRASTNANIVYQIKLETNCVSGTNAAVFITPSNEPGLPSLNFYSYVLTSNVLTITLSGNTVPSAPSFLNFAILQV